MDGFRYLPSSFPCSSLLWFLMIIVMVVLPVEQKRVKSVYANFIKKKTFKEYEMANMSTIFDVLVLAVELTLWWNDVRGVCAINTAG
jgi:hypothetical protein